ncbi:hypothetical protein PFMALIP_03083 [Plasmodium falciparum MaliPS096_E11]|uniref:Uncharacterized protein n=1 Tax=Plasmodium falciparum MaliPS096_E11 TaxID=1036727 RepID=A0A024WQI0_PLAFA|nr:hypothetical protein PFMALIP_03083 [Plasmodium falciparum MaliPS096_E11]
MKKESYRFLNISINNGSDKKKKSNFFVKIKNGTDLKDTKKDRISVPMENTRVHCILWEIIYALEDLEY